MKTTKKTKKTCENCGSDNLKACLKTYPIKIETKQLNVGRVSVRECLDCYAMMPTEAGKEKIGRAMMMYMSLMVRRNPSFT
jgi:hypothetical protein